MKLRFTVLAASILLLAGIAPAQTAAELLQKGIYTQQTAGKVDDSIDIYRQAITAAGTDRAVAARAQMMIVSAMIQKGDFSGAAREFSMFTANYSDQKDLMSSTSSLMRAIATLRTASAQAPQPPAQPTLGTLQNGVYHHTATGVEVHLRDGWTFTGDAAAGGGGDSATFSYGGGSYYMWLRNDPQADIDVALQQDEQFRIHETQGAGALANFRIKESVSPYRWNTRDGKGKGLAVVFEYGKDFENVEYDIWVRTPTNLVFFRARCPAAQLLSAQDALSVLATDTTVP